MAKKKARKKVKKAKKKVAKKRVVKKKAGGTRQKAKGKRQEVKEKILGMIDHFFGKINVAAIKLKAPLKVGDFIHVKGHTTDFTQRIESMQIEHHNVAQAKKGDDIGIRVKSKVRQHDMVFLAAKEQGITAQTAQPAVIQQPMFPKQVPPKAVQKPQKNSGAYSEKKFLQF